MRGSAAFRASVTPGGALAGPWTRNLLWSRARAVPSLDLRFAENKSLTDATTGQNLVTFTRASSGTYVDSTGTLRTATTNEARFDHDPVTGESLGLLVEESRTNLSQQSDNFADVYWAKTDCTITSNESTAPDGTLTADLWTNTGTSGVVQTSITKDATARTYTGSLWVKSNVTAFTLSIDAGGTANRGRVVFNLSNGTLTSTLNDGAFTNTSGTITAYAGNWYRLTVTTTTSTGTVIRLRMFFSNVGATARIWGAQVEEGAFPTSYIPTTTAAATRSADVASITGNNFSSWYRQDEGTIWANGTAPNKSVAGFRTRGFLSINNGTQNESMLMGHSATEGAYRGSLFVGNVNQFTVNAQQTILNVFTASNNYTAKTCIAYKANDLIQSANGLLTSPVSSASLPVTDRMNIGDSLTADGYLNGTIRRLTYWPQRLPNTTLQQITQ